MFNYENGLVGLYLGYYRNQRSKTDNYFKKKEFINCKSKEILELCKNCKKDCAKRKGICSYKTSICLENGEPIKNICYYIDFCYKLGKHYLMNKKIVDITGYIEKQMLVLVKTREKQVVDQFQNFLESILLQYTDVIYFSDLIIFSLQMIQFLKTGKVNHFTMIDFYEKNYSSFNKNWKYLILYVLYQYYHYADTNLEKANYYLTEMNSLYSKNYEMTILEKYDSLSNEERINYLKNISNKTFYSYDIYVVNKYLAQALYETHEYKLALKVIDRCLNEINNENSPLLDILYYKALAKKAKILFSLNKFEECLKIYREVMNYDMNILSHDFIYVVYCMKRTRQHQLITRYINYDQFQRITHPYLRKIYRYYLLLYCSKCSVKVLLGYVEKHLFPIVENNKNFYYLLSEDLFLMCRMLNHYAYYETFENIIA